MAGAQGDKDSGLRGFNVNLSRDELLLKEGYRDIYSLKGGLRILEVSESRCFSLFLLETTVSQCFSLMSILWHTGVFAELFPEILLGCVRSPDVHVGAFGDSPLSSWSPWWLVRIWPLSRGQWHGGSQAETREHNQANVVLLPGTGPHTARSNSLQFVFDFPKPCLGPASEAYDAGKPISNTFSHR